MALVLRRSSSVRDIRRALRIVEAVVRNAVRDELSVGTGVPSAEQDRLLTLGEVAKVLGVSTRTVERLAGRRSIAVVRVGRSRRVHPAALDAYVRSTVR